MSSHPQPLPPSRRAPEARHLQSSATLPLQLARAPTDVGMVDYHARDYSSHLAHAGPDPATPPQTPPCCLSSSPGVREARSSTSATSTSTCRRPAANQSWSTRR
ncbi:nuclear receptor corepressor 2-like [Brachyhypopomus gauderio]|uniref:nuclear receptor corepressor 2-like n=1 Tax=Brachyhypopomus gauderio TaxID=698409 RepID=UPI004041819F